MTLLGAANRLLASPSMDTAGVWSRAATHLARQSLEGLLDELWRARAPGTESCSTRAQLICLPFYVGDEKLARRVAHTWNALSHACHHHAYELAPTAPELQSWIAVIQELGAHMETLNEK